MNIINEPDQNNPKDKIKFYINILSIYIKIKFQCKMYLTYNGKIMTKQVDLHIRDINHASQNTNIFQFNQQILLQKTLDTQEQYFQLTIHLKTLKGQIYQAGFIKLKHQQLFENQGNNQNIKVFLQKSLDVDAFCTYKVQKIQIKTKQDLEENPMIFSNNDEFLITTFNPTMENEFTQARLKSQSNKQIQSKKQFVHKNDVSQNDQYIEDKKNNLYKQNKQKNRLSDFDINQEKSYIDHNSQQQITHQNKNTVKLLKNLLDSGCSEQYHSQQKDSRLSIQLQTKQNTGNTGSKCKIERRYTDQYKYSQNNQRQSSDNRKQYKLQLKTPSKQLKYTNKNSNTLFSQYQQIQQNKQFYNKQSYLTKQKNINSKQQQQQLQLNEPFTPILLLQKQGSGFKKYQSIQDKKNQKTRQTRQTLIMGKSMLNSNQNLLSSSNQLYPSYSSNNLNVNSYGNLRKSTLNFNNQLSHNVRMSRIGSQAFRNQDLQQCQHSLSCQSCSYFFNQLSQSKIIIDSLNKQLQLIKLSQPQISITKQQCILKQQSINRLQQKLRQLIKQNIILQQTSQQHQLQRLKIQKLIEQKDSYLYQYEQKLQLMMREANWKDRMFEESQEENNKLRNQLKELRKELVEKEEIVSMKEIEEIETNSKHKKQLLEINNKLNKQKQDKIVILQRQAHSLQEQLNKIKQHSFSLNVQNVSLKSKIDNLNLANQSLQSQLSLIQNQKNILLQSNTTQKEQRQRNLTQQNVYLQQSAQLLEKECIKLRKQNDQQLDRIRQLSLKNIAIENQAHSNKDQIRRLKQLYLKLQEESMKTIAQMGRNKNQSASLQNQLNCILQQNLGLKQQINRYKQQIAKFRNEINCLLSSAKNKQISEQSAYQYLKQQLQITQKSKSQLQNQISLLKQKVSNLSNINKDLQKQLQRQRQSHLSNSRQIQSNDNRITQQLKLLQHKNKQLQFQIKQLKLQKKISQNNRYQQQRLYKILNKQNKSKQQNTLTTLTSLQSRLVLNHQLEEEINNLKQTLKNERKQLMQTQLENQKIKLELERVKSQKQYIWIEKQQISNKLATQKQQIQLLNRQIHQLKQIRINSSLLLQQQTTLLNKQILQSSMIHSGSPMKRSIFIKQSSSNNQIRQFSLASSQSSSKQQKQQQSYYKALLRKKDEQIQAILQQMEYIKLASYKLQKQAKYQAQDIQMKEEQVKRYINELNEQKIRYNKLMASKSEVQIKNSHLKYQLQQINEQMKKSQKQNKYVINQLQQSLQSNNKEFQKKLKEKQHQIANKITIIQSLEKTLLQNKKQTEKYRKQQKLLKQHCQKLIKQKSTLIKQKSIIADEVQSKSKQIQTLLHHQQSITQKNHQMVVQLQVLNKKQYLLQSTLQNLKIQQKQLRNQFKSKQMIFNQSKSENKLIKKKFKQLAKVMINKICQYEEEKQRVQNELKEFWKLIIKSLPQKMIKKYYQSKQINMNNVINLSERLKGSNVFSFMNSNMNHVHPISNHNQNSMTFFRPTTESKISLANKNSKFIHNEEHEINENSISSIIQNNQNVQPLSPSKVFESVSGLNLGLIQSQNVQKQKQSDKEQNQFLNQSLTNGLVHNDNNVLIDNSFGNINNALNEVQNNMYEKDQNRRSVVIPQLNLKGKQSDNKNEQAKNKALNRKNHSSQKLLLINSKELIEDKNLSQSLFYDSARGGHFRNNSLQNIFQKKSLNQSQRKNIKIKNHKIIYPQDKNIISSLLSINQKSQDINNSKLYIKSKQKIINNKFINILYQCINSDGNDDRFNRFLQQSFIQTHLNQQEQYIPGQKLLISQNGNAYPYELVQQQKQGAFSLPIIQHLFNSISSLNSFILQQNQFLNHQLQTHSKTITQNYQTIRKLQTQLQNQQIQFNEWIQKMQQNLDSRASQKQRECHQLKKQLNTILKKYHSLQTQLSNKYQQIQLITKRLNQCKQNQQTSQQRFQKVKQQLKQKTTELNQLSYQMCVKDQQHIKQKKILNQKLSMSNNHLINLQNQSFRLQQEFLRVRNQYQSMLEYSQQEKNYLKEKIADMEQTISDEKEKRMKAEKLDNFQDANLLYEQNEKLKNQIMKLKRENKMKQISASMILKQKDQQINQLKDQMTRSVPLNQQAFQNKLNRNLNFIKNSDNRNPSINNYQKESNEIQRQYKKFPQDQQIAQSIQAQFDQFFDRKIQDQNENFVGFPQQSHEQIYDYRISSQRVIPANSNIINKKSFQMKNLKQVDSIDSQKADQLQIIIKRLSSISKKQQQFSMRKSQIEKQKQQNDQSLKLLKNHKMKRIQSIEVDLQTFQKQYTPNSVKKQNNQLAIVHNEVDDQMINSGGQIDQCGIQQLKNKLKGYDDKNYQEKQLIRHSQQLQKQMVEKLKRKPIQPPPLISYSGHFYQSPFAPVSSPFSSVDFKKSINDKENFLDGQKEIVMFQSKVSSKKLSQMKSYANIHMVNSEQQIEVDSEPQFQSQQLKQQNQKKQSSNQQYNINKRFSYEDNFQRQKNRLELKIVKSMNISHDQKQNGQILNSRANQLNSQIQSQEQKKIEFQQNNMNCDLVSAEFQKILQ